jgi:hypothetical protein
MMPGERELLQFVKVFHVEYSCLVVTRLGRSFRELA